jgi:hypothetical protein
LPNNARSFWPSNRFDRAAIGATKPEDGVPNSSGTISIWLRLAEKVTKLSIYNNEIEIPATADQTPKNRLCLRCSGPFQSTWSGQRICADCKSSHAWRQGIPARNGIGAAASVRRPPREKR